MNGENYREVYLILNKLGEEYISKIPKTIYNYIVENMTTSNTGNKTIQKESIAFIAALHYKYWTKNDEEKQELIKIFNENKKEQEEIYNQKNVFENSNSTSIQTETTEKAEEPAQTMQLVKVEKWHNKLFRAIKRFFRIGD